MEGAHLHRRTIFRRRWPGRIIPALSLPKRHVLARSALPMVLLLAGCGVRCSGCAPSVVLDADTPADRMVRKDLGHDGIGVPLAPAPRDPGPRRPESPEQLAKAQVAASTFTRTLRASGLDRREVTALADIRGYRLYKRRFFGRAHAWFLAAVAMDGRYELSLYNAARTAALLGRLDQARGLLARLAKLGTPLSRMRLALARKDPDLAVLRGPTAKKARPPRKVPSKRP